MAKKFRKRDFFLRKDLVIPSRNRYKRAMVTGFLAMMCVLISLFYLVYHQVLAIQNFNFYACGTLIAAGVSGFMLNRNGYHLPAKIIVLLTGTISVFLFSAQ